MSIFWKNKAKYFLYKQDLATEKDEIRKKNEKGLPTSNDEEQKFQQKIYEQEFQTDSILVRFNVDNNLEINSNKLRREIFSIQFEPDKRQTHSFLIQMELLLMVAIVIVWTIIAADILKKSLSTHDEDNTKKS